MSYPQQVCVRHPNRPTGLSCVRCGRPSCPDCLESAAVGYQCVDCVRQGRREVRRVRPLAGSVPYVTYTLMGLNVLVYAVTAFQAKNPVDNWPSELFYWWLMWPERVGDGEIWRVLTSGFIHDGIVHLGVNMLALYMLGPAIERALTHLRFLAIFLVSVLGGAAAVMLVDQAAVGASSGIWGLFAPWLMLTIRSRQNPGPVLMWIALNVIISVSIPGISLAGHLGGLAAGAVATAGLLYGPEWFKLRTEERAGLFGWLWIAGVAALTLVLIAIRAVQLG